MTPETIELTQSSKIKYIKKRDGRVVQFTSEKIRNVIKKAFVVQGIHDEDAYTKLTNQVTDYLGEKFQTKIPTVEEVQDIVETILIINKYAGIAKGYILYRSERTKMREEKKKDAVERAIHGKLNIIKKDGKTVSFNLDKVRENFKRAAIGFEKEVSVDLISKETIKNIYEGMTSKDVEKTMIMAAVSFIEKEPAYDHVAVKLTLQNLYKEVMQVSVNEKSLETEYRTSFIKGITKGVEDDVLDKYMLDYDLNKLSDYLRIERDVQFEYMGLKTLYDRYFLKTGEGRYELPQSFWMRVAMGLAFQEQNKEDKVLEFYETISSLRYVPSTPTLFHTGTMHPQLSSCYLTTISDTLHHIFKSVGDNAQLSKLSGGIANDWTYVRAIGARIKGIRNTKVESQGVVPFMKIASDISAAINRVGKRGATCGYLETWHLDIEDFLDLRKNTGDERRRTHDMNTANWIPDLFMKRVLENKQWTLFSPDEVPELHDFYGKKFEKKYEEYEEKARKGEINIYKTVDAVKLWRKMLSMLFETGHPWITFKDACNIRSPQDHYGVVHSSNLCTEITLNTTKDETAVCNLGSVNLSKHIVNGKLDRELLAKTIKTAVRMLDNVIDINLYPTLEGKRSNLKHRPIGLGVMGFQDALFKLGLPMTSLGALTFSDNIMELIAYNVILTSSELAKERGVYQSYKGSKWDRGLLPQDTIALLEEERGIKIEVPKGGVLDWTPVRESIKQYGMRNSNTMAIAPTATISTISGCYPCIEPIYKNIYVKANTSGEFTILNRYLVEDLKKLNIWNDEMLDQIKYYDGNLQMITSIPKNIKNMYKEAFEIDPEWLVNLTAVRAKWIDQSQSHNVFMMGVSGSKLNDIYMYAWKMGLKTTYYLRTLAATQIEKSTLDASKYGYTQKREYESVNNDPPKETKTPNVCESCQ